MPSFSKKLCVILFCDFLNESSIEIKNFAYEFLFDLPNFPELCDNIAVIVPLDNSKVGNLN